MLKMSITNETSLEEIRRQIDQIRRQGLSQSDVQKIQQEKTEMDRLEKENASKLKGNYVSFKEDKETKTLLFTGKYQKVDVPTKDFATGQIIPGKFTQKWRFECYSTSDPNPQTSIWERGWREALIMHFLGLKMPELTIVRNGVRNSNQTTYMIYPASARTADEEEGDRLQREYDEEQYEGGRNV
jgi:hypothetical protein